jgi:hypothetical protein
MPNSRSCVFLKRINRRMHLSVGPSPVPRDQRRRRPGRYDCRRRCGIRYLDGTGVWSMIQIMILGICPDPLFSPRLTIRRPNQLASTRNIANPPASGEIPADSPAVTDSRLPWTATRLRACALRRLSSVTVSARKTVHAPRPAQVPIRRSDRLAVALAQKKDGDGRPAACMAVVPVDGNVSTLLVISKAVRACLAHLSHSACLFP